MQCSLNVIICQQRFKIEPLYTPLTGSDSLSNTSNSDELEWTSKKLTHLQQFFSNVIFNRAVLSSICSHHTYVTSVRLSVTNRYCRKLAKGRILQRTPHNSPCRGSSFWCQRSRPYSSGVTPTLQQGHQIQVHGVGKIIGDFQPISQYNLTISQKRCRIDGCYGMLTETRMASNGAISSDFCDP